MSADAYRRLTARAVFALDADRRANLIRKHGMLTVDQIADRDVMMWSDLDAIRGGVAS